MHSTLLLLAVLRVDAFISSLSPLRCCNHALHQPRRPPPPRSTSEGEELVAASNEDTTTLEHTAPKGGRLDAVVAAAFPDVCSRSEWGEHVKRGAVKVNDKVCTKKATTVAEHDSILIELPSLAFAKEDQTCVAEDLEIDLLYEDKEVLVVNKASGMVTHPAPGHRTGTLANAVAGYCVRDEDGILDGRPGIVHRLDRFTSGCIVVARDSVSRRSLQAQFADRTVAKVYLAVVAKPPPEFDGEELVIDAPIGRHAIHRERMAVTENGRRAVSRVRVLATDGRKCVVQVAIETGRTHQIRVHLAHIGCHVLGDPVYGDDNANRICVNAPFHAKRPLLHAWRLGFDHPATGERINVVAPPPSDMARAVRLVSGR